MNLIKISLVIPIFNEQESLDSLIESINSQSFQPDEIILVDGGSTDNTIEIVERMAVENSKIKFIKTPQASPGKGRNLGVDSAKNDWIAFTDAGIKLETGWLEELVKVAVQNPSVDVVYGNYAPRIGNSFEKCAALAYVRPKRENAIRGIFIASYLAKKTVWEAVGGFPDLRAAEDLIFMEAVEKRGFKVDYAPDAMIHWQLRPDLSTTFSKFVLYSKHNVWAGRQWDWHYGIAKQYLLVFPFVILAVFHSWWWLPVVAAWLFARTAKRILLHRYEFGLQPLLNPIIFFGVLVLILTIDLGTFIGWGQAVLQKKK